MDEKRDDPKRMNPTEFFSAYAPYAETEYKESGLNPAVTLAAAASESGYGGSKLASQYHNFFGVKAGIGWTGQTVTLPTTEVVNGVNETVNAKFRVYPDAQASFDDYAATLHHGGYNNIWGVMQNPYAVTGLIQADGYATDPNYAENLNTIIKDNNLTKYSDGVYNTGSGTDTSSGGGDVIYDPVTGIPISAEVGGGPLPGGTTGSPSSKQTIWQRMGFNAAKFLILLALGIILVVILIHLLPSGVKNAAAVAAAV